MARSQTDGYMFVQLDMSVLYTVMSSKIQSSAYLFMEFTFVKIHVRPDAVVTYLFFLGGGLLLKPDIIKAEGIRTFKHSALTGLCFVQNSAIRPMVQIGEEKR